MSTNKTGAIENKMHQNDHNGVIIREDRKKISNERKRERDSEGNKKEERGKSEKVAGGSVFNICFQGNQPTILWLRHLLS